MRNLTVSTILRFDRAAPEAGCAEDMVGKPIVFFAWDHSGATGDVGRETVGFPFAEKTGRDPFPGPKGEVK
jgi:hypothetical protein